MPQVSVTLSRMVGVVAPLLGAACFCVALSADDGATKYVAYPYEMPVGEACPPVFNDCLPTVQCCPPSNLGTAIIESTTTPAEPVDAPETSASDLPDPIAIPQPPTSEATTVEAVAPNFDVSQGLATNFGSGSSDSLAFSDIPNMMGDYIGGPRSTRFTYNLAGDANPALVSGGTAASNSKLSDNNSAIPRDRVSFRYHRFDDAASVNALRATGQQIFLFDPASNITYFQDEVQGFDQHVPWTKC